MAVLLGGEKESLKEEGEKRREHIESSVPRRKGKKKSCSRRENEKEGKGVFVTTVGEGKRRGEKKRKGIECALLHFGRVREKGLPGGRKKREAGFRSHIPQATRQLYLPNEKGKEGSRGHLYRTGEGPGEEKKREMPPSRMAPKGLFQSRILASKTRGKKKKALDHDRKKKKELLAWRRDEL